MAVDLAPTAAFSRSTTGITAGPLTVCMWMRPDVLPGAGDYQSWWYHGTTGYSNHLEVAFYPDATIRLYDSTFTVRAETTAVSVGSWVFVAFVCSGSDVTLYWRTEGQTSLSSDAGTWSTTLSDQIMYWGSEPGGSPNTAEGAVAYGRVFTSALTATQLLNESINSNSPSASWADYPFGTTFGSDISGNGRRLTFAAGTGSGTVVANPDIRFTPGEVTWVDGIDDADRFDKWTFTVDGTQVSGLNVVNSQGEFTAVAGSSVDLSNLRDIYTLPETSPDASALNCPGVSGAYASTPDAAVLDITADLDVRFEITPADETPAAAQTVIGKYTTTSNQRSWKVTILTTGALQLAWTTNGSTVLFASTGTGAVRAGRWAYRMTMDVVNGANRVITFYQAPRIAGPWTIIGSAVTQAGNTSFFNSTAPLTLSGHTLGTSEMFAGFVHAVEVRNGIDGSIAADLDATVQTLGDTSFVDDAGLTWTVNGQAEVVADTSEVDGFDDARMSTEVVCGPLFTSAVKPQHGIALRAKRDGSKWRAVMVWHDIAFGVPHIINVGVWSANLDGTGFLNRQGNLWMTLGASYTITASSRTSNVVTLTMDPDDLVVGDRLNVDVTNASLDASSVTLTNVTPTTVQYTQTGSDVADGGTGTATRLFPYFLEADLQGTVCRARAWDRTQTRPGWDDPNRALTIDLDTDAAGDAATRAANPTPTNGGRTGIEAGHLGTNDDSRNVYDTTTFAEGPFLSGDLAGTFPTLSVDLAGAAQAAGTLALTLPTVTADTQGSASSTGTFSAVLVGIDSDLAGTGSSTGQLAATLSAASATIAGAGETAATFTPVLPALQADLAGASTASGALTATLSPLEADLAGAANDASGVLGSVLPAAQATFQGAATIVGSTTVALPSLAADFEAQAAAAAILASVLPVLVASMAGGETAVDPNPDTGSFREPGATATTETGFDGRFVEV